MGQLGHGHGTEEKRGGAVGITPDNYTHASPCKRRGNWKEHKLGEFWGGIKKGSLKVRS